MRMPHPSENWNFLHPFSNLNHSTTMGSIEDAINDLNIQEMPNIRGTAKKYNLVESILRRRWRDQTVALKAASSIHKQRLTQAQEEILIIQINRLTDRGLSSINVIVRNLAEEMISSKVGKNWAAHFIKRHQNRLKSLYLRNIESSRMNSKYVFIFKQFYDLIKHLKVKIEAKIESNADISFSCLKHLRNITSSRIMYEIEMKKAFWLNVLL